MEFPFAENQAAEDARKPKVTNLRDSQTDRGRGGYAAMEFGPTSLAEEKENGGWTPLTKPVGMGEPARTSTSSSRGWVDTVALGNKADGDIE
jgi:hypothetical protein